MQCTRWRTALQPLLSARTLGPIAARNRFGMSALQLEKITVTVPQMAESISEGTLASVAKKVGDYVNADEEIASIETDKIDVAVNAPDAGRIIEAFVEEGSVVTVGQRVALIETDEEVSHEPPAQISDTPEKTGETIRVTEPHDTPSPPSLQEHPAKTQIEEASTQPASRQGQPPADSSHSVNPSQNRPFTPSRFERVEKLSRMRQTIAKRLKESQNRTASLTTMQCVDMSAMMELRNRYKDKVLQRYGVKLGYMGAFTKAATLAAQLIPEINASIDTDRGIVTFRDYVDISIAVSTPRGLVTPVLRNCESMDIIEMEMGIAQLAKKARESKLTMDDLNGGNFSISNPGIFGSMFGTPLINYPQSAVFNINSIKEEPVVVDRKIVIRPLMFITLTYDHRLIGGREAVTFLNTVKGYIEDPAKMLLTGGIR